MKKILLAAVAAALLATGPAAPAFAQGGKPDPAAQRPVTAAALVGRWGDNGDCAKDVVFRADGTFRSFTGGEGRWALNGDRLVLTGPNGEFPMRVRWDGPNRLAITNPDGSVGNSQRC